ncbi:MAG: ZIP family metal transporter [Candidatus Edwardsbacteria bacterium]
MNFATVSLYGCLAGLATISGTLLVLSREELAKRYSVYLISFAAGAMFSTSFFHIIPESLALNKESPLLILSGILLFYLMENLIMIHPCPEPLCEIHRIGVVSVIGLTFHSLLDGIAIAAGFSASRSLGILTTLAVISHEIPEGLVTAGILLHSKMKRRLVLGYSLLVALATPFGAIISSFFLYWISKSFLGFLLALAAGSFIYIAVSDLIPETHRANNKINALILISGVLILAVIGRLLP